MRGDLQQRDQKGEGLPVGAESGPHVGAPSRARRGDYTDRPSHSPLPCLHTYRHACALSPGEGNTSLGDQSTFRFFEIILESNSYFLNDNTNRKSI